MDGRLVVTYVIGTDTYRLVVEVPALEGAEPSLSSLFRTTQLATRDLEELVRRQRFPTERPRPKQEL
jgi:hypothetical protein